jgi:hypothetical protein
MKMIYVAGATAVLIATLAACGSSAPSPTPTGPAATGSATGSATGGGQTATTTADPCQLVTAQEASTLTGATYGPGTERAVGVGKTCVYGGGTKNVLMVDVWQGSAALLQQMRGLLTAELEQGSDSAHIDSIPVSGLGDSATAYAVSGEPFNASSIYVLKGNYAIYLVDEVTGSPAPTTAALTATARTAVGRLP